MNDLPLIGGIPFIYTVQLNKNANHDENVDDELMKKLLDESDYSIREDNSDDEYDDRKRILKAKLLQATGFRNLIIDSAQRVVNRALNSQKRKVTSGLAHIITTPDIHSIKTEKLNKIIKCVPKREQQVIRRYLLLRDIDNASDSDDDGDV